MFLFGLAVVTLLLFAKVVGFGFLLYDDYNYVHSNLHVQQGLSGHGLLWAFTTSHAGNWHPVTWISHMLDCQFYGYQNAGGHHFTNVVLHVANAILLFLLMQRMTGAFWRSAFVAALFAWHPSHVESVAWIAERKDLLSTFFGILTLHCYLRHVSTKLAFKIGESKKYFLLTMICFAFSLMSKPMWVTLPFLLLLLEYWPLARFLPETGLTLRGVFQGNFPTLVLEKLPLFAISLADCIITLSVQQGGGAVASLKTISFLDRVCNVFSGYGSYLARFFWPLRLAAFYPLQTGSLMGHAVIGLFIVLLLTVVCLRVGRSCRAVLVGWLWFLGMLVPVIGFVQVGSQATADRYTYFPYVGLSIALVWGMDMLALSNALVKKALPIVSVTILILCCGLTWKQVGYWRDTEALAMRSQEVCGDSATVENLLGLYFDETGKADEAFAHYEKSLKLDGNRSETFRCMALNQSRRGHFSEAILLYKKGFEMGPVNAVYHYNYANALAGNGDVADAIMEYQKAILLDPDSAESHNNLAAMMIRVGNYADAESELKSALRIDADAPQSRVQLAEIYIKRGQPQAAITLLAGVLEIKPEFTEARLQYGITLARTGKINEAITQLEMVVNIQPANSEARFNLAACYDAAGNFSGSVSNFSIVLKLNPKDFDSARRKAMALTQMTRWKEAIEAYGEALALKPDSVSTLLGLCNLLVGCPDKSVRDASLALSLAKKADELTGHNNLSALTALDMALAAAGQFDKAVVASEATAELADKLGEKQKSSESHRRTELYRQKKSFFQ